jgi:hypothetical protein
MTKIMFAPLGMAARGGRDDVASLFRLRMNPPVLRLVLCHGYLALLLGGRAPAAETDSPLQAVEQSAHDWIKVRAETTRLETAWRTEQRLLESTVASLKDRATALEEKREQIKAQTADQRAELNGLHAKQRSEQEQLQLADGRLQKLGERLVQLRPSLPPRLSEALELPYRSLNGTDAGERMQYALAVLNRCAQFNRTLSCGEEIVAVDGAARSLEVIYWGLSHGYALDRSNGKVWLGSPAGGRWQWQPVDGVTKEVTRLIDIYRDKTDPALVMVPARVANLNR